MLMILTILVPIIGAVLLPVLKPEGRKMRLIAAGTSVATAVLAFITASSRTSLTLFSMTDEVTIKFATDGLGVFFSIIISVAFAAVTFYSFVYMEHEGEENRFFAFYLLSFAFMLAVCYAANLATLYFTFECVTLCSMPLVLHSLKKEAVSAALKYLFYSVAGALLALLAVFFVWNYSSMHDFVLGGSLDMAKVAGHEAVLLAVIFMSIIGFGTKAGMYPMHGWLPTAHPVAPAPASALLSGIIAKAGIIAIIRVVYYSVGTEFLRGTWVQTAWIILALITVFMGSMMAYREKILKKRLAYSTVSNISYIMLGLACLTPEGLVGGLFHVAAHAAAKVVLFLVAGVIIVREEKTNVDELEGIGLRMPITIWCFTISALSLIGIPPLGGFVSKWYISEAAISCGLGRLGVAIPVVLLISALLTAGYLLPITIKGFFPGEEYDRTAAKTEPGWLMLAPMIFVTVLGVLIGVFGNTLSTVISSFIAGL